MSRRFINQHVVQENVLKMQKLVYCNNINEYLVKMNLLSARVEGAGALYRETIRAGLPTENRSHMSYGGEEPDDSTEFIDFFRRMGKRHEEHQHMTKGERKNSTKQDTKDATSTTKPPRQSRLCKTSEHPHQHQQKECRTHHLQ